MPWFDTHCHLDRLPASFRAGKALSRAAKAGVDKILVPGVNGSPVISGLKTVEVTVLTAWGIHPEFISEDNICLSDPSPWEVSGGKPVAIGECGLDRRVEIALERQEEAFCWQLQLARRHHLPVIVHLVGHAQRALALLRSLRPDAGFVMHSFSGSAEMAAAFVKIGGSISLSASCLLNPEKLKKLLAAIPLSALLLETDAPDMPLPDWPEICNEPAALPAIGRGIAEISGIGVEKLAEVLYTNASRIFTRKAP